MADPSPPDNKPAEAPKPQASPNALEHYRIVMETFRHHTDVYLKAFALYVTIVGAVAGLAFGEDGGERRGALLAFLAAVSIFAVVANGAVLRTGAAVEERLRKLGEDLEVDPWPLGPVRALVWLILVFCGTVAVAALWLLRG